MIQNPSRPRAWTLALALTLSLPFALIGVLLSTDAAAYSSPKLFAAPAHEGGGAGRHYTGSRLDGHGCDTCHGGSAEDFALELGGLPEGAWVPGLTYTLDVAWSPTIEHAALLAEFTDEAGLAVGSLTLPPEDLLTLAERCGSGTRAAQTLSVDENLGTRELVAIGDCGAHRMRVQWRAPADPTLGAISLHLAAVRGDGSGDATGDAVVVEHRAFPSLTAAPSAGGCDVAGPGEPNWQKLLGAGVFAALIFAWARRRQRQRLPWKARRLLPVVACLFGALGCAQVQPWERGRLAQPDMSMELDADLLAGPNHAVEYREGSAGSLGGAGGGCGCN